MFSSVSSTIYIVFILLTFLRCGRTRSTRTTWHIFVNFVNTGSLQFILITSKTRYYLKMFILVNPNSKFEQKFIFLSPWWCGFYIYRYKIWKQNIFFNKKNTRKSTQAWSGFTANAAAAAMSGTVFRIIIFVNFGCCEECGLVFCKYQIFSWKMAVLFKNSFKNRSLTKF